MGALETAGETDAKRPDTGAHWAHTAKHHCSPVRGEWGQHQTGSRRFKIIKITTNRPNIMALRIAGGSQASA